MTKYDRYLLNRAFYVNTKVDEIDKFFDTTTFEYQCSLYFKFSYSHYICFSPYTETCLKIAQYHDNLNQFDYHLRSLTVDSAKLLIKYGFDPSHALSKVVNLLPLGQSISAEIIKVFIAAGGKLTLTAQEELIKQWGKFNCLFGGTMFATLTLLLTNINQICRLYSKTLDQKSAWKCLQIIMNEYTAPCLINKWNIPGDKARIISILTTEELQVIPIELWTIVLYYTRQMHIFSLCTKYKLPIEYTGGHFIR